MIVMRLRNVGNSREWRLNAIQGDLIEKREKGMMGRIPWVLK